MPKIIDHPMILFADDSTVIISGENVGSYETEINRTLSIIIEWLTRNNLKINLDKTKLMTFRQRTDPPSLRVAFNGHKIDETDITKFLGLKVDNKLTWKHQIDSMCTKLNQFSYALYNLRKRVSWSAVLTAYHAFVTSTLRYGIIFWGNSTDREIIFRAQKRCVRSVCGAAPLESCKPYFKHLNILTLPSLYIYEMSVFVKQNSHLYHSFNSTRLRHRILHHVVPNTALYQKNVLGMAPKIYNKLPLRIKSVQELNTFKTLLKKLLVDKCYYTVNEFLEDLI